jgi:hypothetical protein
MDSNKNIYTHPPVFLPHRYLADAAQERGGEYRLALIRTFFQMRRRFRSPTSASHMIPRVFQS